MKFVWNPDDIEKGRKLYTAAYHYLVVEMSKPFSDWALVRNDGTLMSYGNKERIVDFLNKAGHYSPYQF